MMRFEETHHKEAFSIKNFLKLLYIEYSLT
ncbi:hypothetical protein HDF26_001462 [Pedobacter cryoconitis]|nr:hypothetical protein [Pedobacter cryoconitis]